MEEDDPFRPESAEGAGGSSLQIASLVLGAMSIPGALFLGLGILPGLVGLVLGILAARRAGWGSGMALLGVVLSLLGILMSVGIVVLMWWGFGQAKSMTAEMASSQLQVNQAWQGVRAPALTLTADDGAVFDFRERDGKKLVVYQYFPMGGPFMDSAPTEVINRLWDEADDDYDVVVLMQMPLVSATQLAGDAGVTAPVVGSQTLPDPFSMMSMNSFYFVIDGNGVIQHTFSTDATYEELADAVSGAGFRRDDCRHSRSERNRFRFLP
jgi:cytochrome oxidase Cu insertion factor (SCO1/SenC/PrrC family)